MRKIIPIVLFAAFVCIPSFVLALTDIATLKSDPSPIEVMHLTACQCNQSGHVTIVCEGDAWNGSVNFERFDEDSLFVQSHQNGYGAFCTPTDFFDSLFEHKKKIELCNLEDEDPSEKCTQVCKDQISSLDLMRVYSALRTCVDYFEAQCTTSITTEGGYESELYEGSFDEYIFRPDGWWAVGGGCRSVERDDK